MTKSYVAKAEDVTRKWYVVDAAGKPVGRIAVEIANTLRGKNKPTFTPHVDTGDFVVVVNAEKVKLTGDKETKKLYRWYTGFPNGLKEMTAGEMREKHPTRIVHHAVQGMLPKNRLNRRIIKRLKVYAGSKHPHEAQQPEPLNV